MKDITKKYTKGDMTILWKPTLCIHSGICVGGLSEVFDPKSRPWITPENSTTEKIIEQIKKCPSGALSFEMNNNNGEKTMSAETETIIEIRENGPLLVKGDITLKDASGNLTKRSNSTTLCRCGASANKPFCDGSHKKIEFVG